MLGHGSLSETDIARGIVTGRGANFRARIGSVGFAAIDIEDMAGDE